MKIKVNVEKTVQDAQFEPFKVSLGIEEDRDFDKPSDSLSVLAKIESRLEQLCDDIINKRIDQMEQARKEL
jgi:hypothetical protein